MFELIREAYSAEVFLGLAVAAAAAGLARGFSGFGSAMIFMPVASALTSPETAVVLLLLTDALLTLPMLVPAARRCVWREVLPLGVGAALTVPFGVWLLVVLDPVLMRWIISLLILVLIVVLISGRRWRSPPGRFGTALVGGASGLTGGMTGLAGPPVILFWMAGQTNAATLRANIIIFFGMTGLFNAIAYLFGGLLTAERVAGGIVLIPPYAVALLLGIWLFRFASDRFFRILAFGFCAFAAISSLPLLDGLY